MNTTPSNVLSEINYHLEAAAALAVSNEVERKYIIERWEQAVAEVGDAAGYKRTETGQRVGMGKSAIYEAAKREIVTPTIDSLCPEHVLNVFFRAGQPLTAGEVAVQLGKDEARLEILLDSMSRDYLKVVKGTVPHVYQLRDGVNAFTHSYPSSVEDRRDRRERAASAGYTSGNSKFFSLTVKLSELKAEALYKFLRNYKNKLPSEDLLLARQGEGKGSDILDTESTFAALMMFGPDRDEKDAIDHYRTCDAFYCDPRYEMIPYRYPLSDAAINSFLHEDFDKVMDEVSTFLGSYRGKDNCGVAYRMSFVCRPTTC